MAPKPLREFVGRETQKQALREILDQPISKPQIMFIWGPGGIGKTWLIKEMLKAATQHPSNPLVLDQLIDMYATDVRHPEGVVAAIVERLPLNVTTDMFATYDEARKELDRVRQEPGYSQEGIDNKLKTLINTFRACIQQVSADRPIVLAFDTFEHVQDGPVGKWILSEDGLYMPGVICLIASRQADPRKPDQPPLGGLSNEEAVKFYFSYTNSDEEETPELKEFVAKLNQKVEGNPLLLALAILWSQGNALTSGRLDKIEPEKFKREIVWNLRSTEGSGLRNLGGLYLDEPMYQTLVCMAYLNRRFNEFFLERLIRHKYVRLGGVTQKQIWEQLQQPHFFFVKERPKGEIQLHDILAELLRQYLLSDVFYDLTGEKWRQFTQDAVMWYDELLSEYERTQSDTAVLKVEKLAYVLQLDAPSERQQPDFEQAKKLLMGYMRDRFDVLDRLVISEMKPEVVERFPQDDRYEVYSTLGEMASRAYLYEQSRDYWTQALEISKELNNPEQQVNALLGQHSSTWRSDPAVSLQILDQALIICNQIEQVRPRVLHRMGFTHRQIQNLEEAIGCYEKALQLAAQLEDKRMMPTILNDIGYAHLLVGNYNQAEIYIGEAKRFRQHNLNMTLKRQAELEQQLKMETIPDKQRLLIGEKQALQDQFHVANLDLGTSYNTLGHLKRYEDDIANATVNYSEALSIFRGEQAHAWQIRTLYSRGEAYRRLAMSLYNADRIESSRQYNDLAYGDIINSLQLCQQYGLVTEQDTASRRLGRLLHDQAFRTEDLEERLNLLDQARQYFEVGLQIALDTKDVLEELENLTEIAFLADDRIATLRRSHPDKAKKEEKDVAEYIERLREGIERHRIDQPRIYQFPVFENLLKIEEGAFYYALGDYDKSLRHYVAGYVGLASDPGYGSARYKAHLDHLIRNIRQLDDPKLQKQWYGRFITEWETNRMQRGEPKTLAEAHPELVERCKLEQLGAFMFR